MKRHITLAVSSVAIASTLVFPANAQGSAPTAQPAEGGDIVVTAQKREERLVDVPISITAASMERVESAGLSDLRDLAQITPGLLNTNNGLAFQPAIRGITNTGTSAGEESNTALYIDDVYLPAQFAGLFELKNIKRVEVLKGPQGTLYGRNSTAGAIKVITEDPDFSPALRARIGYGFKQSLREASLYATTPVSDNLAIDLAGVYVEDNGFVKNINPAFARRDDLAVKDYWALRSKILWKSGDNFTLIMAGDLYNSKNNAAYTLAPVDNKLVYRSRPGVILANAPYQTSYSVEPRLNSKGGGASATATLDLAAVTLKSVSAYRTDRIDTQSDSDRTNLAISSFGSRAKSTSYSQELDVSSSGDGPFSWIAGLFYFDSKSGGRTSVYAGDVVPGSLSSKTEGHVRTRSYAGFGELTYRLTDQLSVTAGGRYTSERKRITFADIVRPQPAPPAAPLPLRGYTDAHTWTNASFRGIVAYKPSNNSNLYISYSTGFKSGVYNSSSGTPNFVDPERIKALEVGAKANVGGVSLSAAAYHYDYSNIQLQSYDPTATSLTILLRNAAKAKVQGFEFDASSALGKYFSANMGLSWMPAAKYTSFPGAQVFLPLANGGNQAVLRDISGTRMIRAPKFTLNAGGAFRSEVAQGELKVAGNVAYNSGFFFQPGETAHQSSYTLVNANISWKTSDRRFTFTLYSENLTNELYYIYFPQSSVGDTVSFGRPREIGVRLDVSF